MEYMWGLKTGGKRHAIAVDAKNFDYGLCGEAVDAHDDTTNFDSGALDACGNCTTLIADQRSAGDG